MNVAVGAMVRNAEGFLHRYFRQINELGRLLEERGDRVRFIFGANDSTDRTDYLLNEFGGCGHFDTIIIDRSEGGPHYPSIEHPDRWRHIAHVCNGVLDEVSVDDDFFVYVECDLIWEPSTILHLLDLAEAKGVVGAPVFQEGRFYDLWGTRKDDRRFVGYPPHHPCEPAGVFEVDSAAGCTVLQADIAMKTRFSEHDAYVGWCRDIREQGHRFWLDWDSRVEHP